MNTDPVTPGRIIFLSGTSSSGKTSATKKLAEQGWKRIEADAERPVVVIRILKQSQLEKLSFIESHVTNPTPEKVMEALYGIPPDKPPLNWDKYKAICEELIEFIESKENKTDQVVLIHMLDKALEIAKKGESVILDHVPMLNDPGFEHHKIVLDHQSPNLWCYQDIKIEQHLKYVPIEILMRNVIRRNKSAQDHREAPMVLEQYSKCFAVSNTKEDVQLGTLDVAQFKKWIERAYLMNFFDMSPSHAFHYNEQEDIDVSIEKRMQEFLQEIANPDHAVDPEGKKMEGDDLIELKKRKDSYPQLRELIASKTESILKSMNIPEGATKVSLTYRSPSGIKPTIIRDE